MKDDFGISRWKQKVLKIHSKYLIYNTNFLISFFSYFIDFICINKIKYSILKFIR